MRSPRIGVLQRLEKGRCMTLTARLLFGFVLIAAAGFYFLVKETVKRVERQYLEALEEPMVDAAHVLAALLEQDFRDGKLDASRFAATFQAASSRNFVAKIYSVVKTHISLEAYVTDEKGILLFDSSGRVSPGTDLSARRDVRLTLQGSYGARSTRTDDKDDDSSVMYVGAPVLHEGRIVGVVSVSKPQRSVFQFRDETQTWLQWRIGGIVFCMVLGSFLLARWAARPVERLTAHAEAIARGERPPTPQLVGQDMKTLGLAFEKMRDELEGREYVENYVQTLTHELKSPVAAIRGAAELLAEAPPEAQRAKFLANIGLETHRLQDLIDRLLELSSLEKKKSLDEKREISLSSVVEGAIDHLLPAAQRKGLTIERSIAPDIQICGDAFLLEVAVMNLLQNALDFSPDHGCIRVGLEQAGDVVRCVIRDEGPGVPEFAQQRVFERFYSLPRPASGHKSSGLGLCFVREIAQLHGGTVSLKNDLDRGAIAELVLPLRKTS